MLDFKKILAGATIAASALVVPMTLSAQPASAATEVGTSVGVHTATQCDDGPRKVKKVKKVQVDNTGGNIGNGNGGNANGSSGSGAPGGNGGSGNSGDINIGNG